MHRVLRFGASLVLAGILGAGAVSADEELLVPLTVDNAQTEATVTRAVDGGSLDARVDGMRTALGYAGVSVPGLNQACGGEALARNQELAGAHVFLEPDPLHEFDLVGRRLFYAYTTDGVSIDETLIREGLARAERVDGAHGAYLLQVQQEAETAGVGCLWSAG